MKKNDIKIIAVILVIAGVIMLAGYFQSAVPGAGPSAEVYVDGKLYKSIALTKEEKIIEVVTDYGKNTVKVHDDGVEMFDADCPDQVCKGFGFKTQTDDPIVCLPHHLYIEIKQEAGR